MTAGAKQKHSRILSGLCFSWRMFLLAREGDRDLLPFSFYYQYFFSLVYPEPRQFQRIRPKCIPVAVGRENFLFAGSHQGAQRLAKIYSLIGICKMNGIDPWVWLSDVIARINNHPINAIQELLPHNWKKSSQ